MKYSLLLLLAISSCTMKKNTTSTKDFSRLQGTWALTAIEGEIYAEGDSPNHPTLEVNLMENKVFGHDGCNRFFGGIDSIDHKILHIGMLAGTKMMCPDMKIAETFGLLLSSTRKYRLQELELTLMNINGQELLTFKKIG